MGTESNLSRATSYLEGSAAPEPAAAGASNGLVLDALDGFGNGFRARVDGVRQILGSDVDLSYVQNENSTEKAGHAAADALMFIGGAVLMKKLPGLAQVAEGKLATVATGGLLGLTTPLMPNEKGVDRLLNTGLGAGTMALMEFGPNVLGKLPVLQALPEKSLAVSLAKYGLPSGLAGLVNTDGQSLIHTGENASARDLLIGAGTWMAMGTGARQLGNRIESFQAARGESRAAYLPENAPWQFKDVKDINAADLTPGQKLAPGNYRLTFTSEGAERKANIYVSEAAANGARPAPVITHLHGLNPNGEAEGILSELNYYKFADQDGAVVAMLQGRNGLKGLGTYQSFHDTNFGYANPAPGVAPYSDQVSFGDMMRIVRDHVPNADGNNIAVSGFSLGGKMANRIAATRPDVAAVASIHGTLDKFDEEVMNAAMHKHPVDGIFVLGTNDKVLPAAGGKSIFTLGLENNHLSQPVRQAEFWGESNGNANALTTDTPNYVRRDWPSTTGENRVTEYTVKGGAHAIDGAVPRRNLIQWIMGVPKPADVFDARQKTWDFMIDSIKARNAQQAPATQAKISA